jgi:hypothetical protein
MKQITFDEFETKFRPLSEDGSMKWIDKNDQEFLDAPIENIWSIIETEGDPVIISGCHAVNRLDYLVCEVARDNQTDEFEVTDW